MEKRIILTFLIIELFSILTFGKSPLDKFFTRSDKFFKKNVEVGLVNYKAILSSPKELNELILSIETLKFKTEPVEIQKSYLVNVYNLLVIKSIIDKYPLDFPLESKGLFSGVNYNVDGDFITLNDVEARLASFNDVRILFLLSPASVGSPSLAPFAYMPDKLEKQMEERIKKISNSSEFIRVAKNTSTILMAESFLHSQENFPREDIIMWVNKFREEPLPEGYKLDFYPANRNLNSIGIIDW